MKNVEVIGTPAEFGTPRDLRETVCVVFDVLRATSSIVTALANGAAGVMPVSEISEALVERKRHAGILLAGERNGVRIRGALTGGVDFDFGNSPREFTAEKVCGKTIVMTTTNGTRALRSCAGAKMILAGSFLNLAATAKRVRELSPENLLLVGSGTGEAEALEDTLAAGALIAELDAAISPSAQRAVEIYRKYRTLTEAMEDSVNGRRLLANPDLREDVAFCLRRDVWDLTAVLDRHGALVAV